jgi:limonene 1,2-monooxygenase
MTLAGKHGAGVISLASTSTAGLNALPTQWAFAEDAAKLSGAKIDRKNWRVLLSWHIAETREQAHREARDGLFKWRNEYQVGTLMAPGVTPAKTPEEAIEMTALVEGAAGVVGTPDDLVAKIKQVHAAAGGFGTVIGFVHDWANPENTRRSWDMVARYVIPEINKYTQGLRDSREYLVEHRESFLAAGQAVMAKIMGNERAVAALTATQQGQQAIGSHNAPDLKKA